MNEGAGARVRSGGFSDLRVRIFSALVLGAAAIGTLVLGGWPFVIFWLIAALAVHWEWQHLVGGERVRWRVLLGNAALCVAAALSVHLAEDLAAYFLVPFSVVLALLAGAGRRLWAASGLLYAGILIVCVVMIRPALGLPIERPFDVRTIVWLFAVVWGTDVMAYFAGRTIGGPKVWPAVSAGKTWSGTLVGIVCGAFLGLAVASIRSVVPVATGPILGVGLAAAAAAQAGDFLESGVKRHFGVKDSSALIPGHGGVMDRLDGFIGAAAFIVLLYLWRDTSSVGEAVFRW